MSIKTTVTLTREQAIDKIINKKCIEIREIIRGTLNNFKNRDLEDLLDRVYYDSPFENYYIKGDD